MENRTIKLLKGVLLCITFVAMGVSIPEQPVGTLRYLLDLGIPTSVFALWFIVSGIANALIALFNHKWNAIWIAAWVMYSVATVVGYFHNSGVPIITILAYSILSALLLIDVFQDAGLFRMGFTWKRHKL